jgi:hypothetical protein
MTMKKLLLLIGITGVLGLVNAGTRANAAINPSAPDGHDSAPSYTCHELCEDTCVDIEHCECGGCNSEGAFVCIGNCQV